MDPRHLQTKSMMGYEVCTRCWVESKGEFFGKCFSQSWRIETHLYGQLFQGSLKKEAQKKLWLLRNRDLKSEQASSALSEIGM